MSLTDTPATTEDTAAKIPRRRRWPWLVVAALVAVLLAGGWWWLTIPRLEDALVSGVSSSDHDIYVVEGPETDMYVIPAKETGETMVVFGVHNTGRLPVRIMEVWPDPEPSDCTFAPTLRELRDDPRTMFTSESPPKPAAGADIPAGGLATFWLTGTQQQRPGGCEHGAITSVDDVEMTVSIAGRTSSVRVPLGYRIGWTDDPETSTAHYGVTVNSPGP